MTFHKIEDERQLSMEPILEAPLQRAKTNADRQREWRERQKKLGRKAATFTCTEKEKYYLQRVLEEMRQTGGTPAAMRDAKGKFYHLDV